MLQLRRAGLIDTNVKTVTGEKLDTCLDWWQDSRRRYELRATLKKLDGIDPDDVIMSPDRAKSNGLTSTVCFPVGNLAPDGSSLKAPQLIRLWSMPMVSTANAAPPKFMCTRRLHSRHQRWRHP